MGLDWGERRIGVALGDYETKVATPLTVVGDRGEIHDLIRREKPDVVIIGDPRRMSGAEQNQPGFLAFVEFVKKIAPVKLIDERLTSKAADALSGDKKTKGDRDAVAAMIILQSYLDKVSEGIG
jgi:putative Holliday junction resolvase